MNKLSLILISNIQSVVDRLDAWSEHHNFKKRHALPGSVDEITNANYEANYKKLVAELNQVIEALKRES